MANSKKVGRIAASKMSQQKWQDAVAKILNTPAFMNVKQFREMCEISNADCGKAIYGEIFGAMKKLHKRLSGGRTVMRPPPCHEAVGSKRKRLYNQHQLGRIYADVLELDHLGYSIVITCKIEFSRQKRRWILSDARFAAIKKQSKITLYEMLNRNYWLANFSVAIYTSKANSNHKIRLTFDAAGFKFCHWLEDDPKRTRIAKLRLMKEQLVTLKTEIENSGIWPKDRRTKASRRLDNYLEDYITRYVYLQENSQRPIQDLVDEIIEKIDSAKADSSPCSATTIPSYQFHILFGRHHWLR